MSSTTPDVMRVVCQLACFYFHLEPQRGSVSIPPMSHLAAVALRSIYTVQCMCTWMYVLFGKSDSDETGCLPVGITATQEADNQSPLACIASN